MEVLIYNFFHTHPLYATGVGFIIVSAITLFFAKEKRKMLGYNISQFMRRTFGKKVEEIVEDVVDDVSEGLHSDDEKK